MKTLRFLPLWLLLTLPAAAQVPDTLGHSLARPAAGAAGDHFGAHVAISGTRMAVGAPLEDTGAQDAGSVYIYDLAQATPEAPLLTLHNPNPIAGNWFGGVVAMSGSRVVVGMTGVYGVSAYIYDLNGSTPTVPTVTINNPDPLGGFFGAAVAISGTRVLVAAPIDDAGASGAGRVYVYDLANATPAAPVLTLNNPAPSVYAFYGNSVSISGSLAVVGCPFDDMGAVDTGIAYVYNLLGGTPMTPMAILSNPSPDEGDYFGNWVAISGSHVVVSAPSDDASASDAGRAYIYDVSSATPSVPIVTLPNPGPSAGDAFGDRVAISGSRVVIGAYNDDEGATNAGSAYVYELTSAVPAVPIATLHNPDPMDSDEFGAAVAVDGTTIVVGTPGDNAGGTDAGFAYVFAPANPDYDGDGLLDIWEYARFGSITAHTATDDTDGDGLKELLEQAFNTDPLAIDSPAAVPAVVSEGNFLTITLSKRAGVSYTVETAGSPDGAAFSTATTTMITNTASTLKVRDNFTPSTAAQRYMRVKVMAAP